MFAFKMSKTVWKHAYIKGEAQKARTLNKRGREVIMIIVLVTWKCQWGVNEEL